MPNKSFLEDYALYRPLSLAMPSNRGHWPKPAINADCPMCGGLQTFRMVNHYEQNAEDKQVAVGYKNFFSPVVRLVYRCSGCSATDRFYLLYVTQKLPAVPPGVALPANVPSTVQKVGQWPPYDLRLDPELEKYLGARVGTYRKGMICESQSYGIGAFAYYRRIVEDLTDELLNDIRAVVPPEGAEDYSAALVAASNSHRASDKLEIVKDFLPASLRPGGHNPLALLHSSLSEGLHGLSDEECLERAVAIRSALGFLVRQVSQLKAAGAQFQRDLQHIAEAKAKKSGAS